MNTRLKSSTDIMTGLGAEKACKSNILLNVKTSYPNIARVKLVLLLLFPNSQETSL